MRVLVCGSRDWGTFPSHLHKLSTIQQLAITKRVEAERVRLREVLDGLHDQYGFTLVIEGEAKGADTLAKMWATKRQIPVDPYPAHWSLYHNGAGPRRNQQMLDEGDPELGVAFSHNLLESRGTADMVRRLAKAQVPHWVASMTDLELR